MYNGIAIALAWPDTLCKEPGSWYDRPMKWLGVNKNHYYKVGHSAVVLIENESGVCSYYDFGRYHSPYQHGRVRSAFTDHELKINSKAKLSKKGGLENYNEILLEVFNNPSCHGTGQLFASYCEVDFKAAQEKAIQMQLESPIAYGPFLPFGTNCSRFVNNVLLAGRPKWYHQFVLAYPRTLSPTPMGNVMALSNYSIIGFSTRYRGNRKVELNRIEPIVYEAI